VPEQLPGASKQYPEFILPVEKASCSSEGAEENPRQNGLFVLS
jgi:hypothetical protein